MKVEIWSDIVCPFCYIGKRKFERALHDFIGKDTVTIEWRSFQLDPTMKFVPGQSVHQYLANRKGCSVEEAQQMNEAMTNMAKEVGLEYNFDIAVVNNTLNAHRLLHFSKTKGVQTIMKERLFHAYYTEGKNISDIDILALLASELGLDALEVKTMLNSNDFIKEVELDQYVAQQVGARAVPFFVFNNKFAVSGAQPVDVFKEILEKVFDEESLSVITQTETKVCTPDGKCDE